jgi:transcriptional regulator with XRE-family HTH domain
MQRVHIEATGNRLKALREARGLRLVHVGAHINRDQATVYRYETGTTRIPDDIKAELACLFGVSRAYLMGWDEPDRPEESAA